MHRQHAAHSHSLIMHCCPCCRPARLLTATEIHAMSGSYQHGCSMWTAYKLPKPLKRTSHVHTCIGAVCGGGGGSGQAEQSQREQPVAEVDGHRQTLLSPCIPYQSQPQMGWVQCVVETSWLDLCIHCEQPYSDQMWCSTWWRRWCWPSRASSSASATAPPGCPGLSPPPTSSSAPRATTWAR